MGVWNVFHCIHYSCPDSCNSVVWKTNRVCLNHAPYVFAHRVNGLDGKQQVEDDMILKLLAIHYWVVLAVWNGSESCWKQYGIIWTTDINQRFNTPLYTITLTLVPWRMKCGGIRSSSLLMNPRMKSEVRYFLCMAVRTSSVILHSHRSFCGSFSVFLSGKKRAQYRFLLMFYVFKEEFVSGQLTIFGSPGQ